MAKTVAKKKTAKKATAKTVTKKKTVAKKKVNAPKQSYFYVTDGKVLKNLKDLALELEHIADNIFYNHVNAVKNDFANWVRDIFNEDSLAQDLCEASDKHECQKVVLKFIVKNQ
ncbi:hypothetical protein GOV04_02630 [Candidatus Woesearchaeota archaeon]|nr:hypothetical protein [Candidatus Woesearchaeota archaeon]